MARYSNHLLLFLIGFLSALLTSLSQEFCEDYVNGNQVVVNQPLIDELSSGAVSLRQFVECLTDGGELIFQESLDVGTLLIASSIRIQGSSGEATSSITCRDGPIFLVNATDVQLSNLEIRDCGLDSEDAPVVLLSGGSAELDSVNFTSNTNEAGSAALKMEADSELVVHGCHFHGNNGTWGTIHVTDGNALNISSSTFVNNIAYLGGGALRIESEQRRTTVVIKDGSAFVNNEVIDGEGGAIFATGNISLTITEETIFRRNKAANQGGALFIRGSSALRIEDAFFVESESNFIGGGAIFAENFRSAKLDVRILNTILSKNVAKNRLGSGGAIRLEGSGIACKIEDGSSFISNVAELDGGAIHASEGVAMNISSTSFIGNEVHQGEGAALYAMSSLSTGSSIQPMKLRLESSMFLHNRVVAGARGGVVGFSSLGTQVLIKGCQFLENESLRGSGGAVHVFDGPCLTLLNSIFADNRAKQGGAIFAENDVKCNVTECSFLRNRAERGGAVYIDGAATTAFLHSNFTENQVAKEGGAIWFENHAISRSTRARLLLNNNKIIGNNAGLAMVRDSPDSDMPRGGGIMLVGKGLFIHLKENTFASNSAYHGGGAMFIGVTHLRFSGFSSFESNIANFGGAMFFIVDSANDMQGEVYTIEGVEFLNNTANSDGGAVRMMSSILTNDFLPFNAAITTAQFINTVFKENTAANIGGGIMATGVGLEIINASFVNNTAISTVVLLASGSGGAIAAVNGARIKIKGSEIRNNTANATGGGLFVQDSSVSVSYSTFQDNRVNGVEGSGGAVALFLEATRALSRLENTTTLRSALFECSNCTFIGNSASLQGGGIYHYRGAPYANFSQMWSCDNIRSWSAMMESTEPTKMCELLEDLRSSLLNGRVIALHNTSFIRNTAQRGAALFTNYPAMINITQDTLRPLEFPIIQAVSNTSMLSTSGISFANNTNSEVGYGPDYASFPAKAVVFLEEDNEGNSTVILDDFRSGDPLDFRIEFYDFFQQRVNAVRNFTAEIRVDNTGPQESLRFTGQRTGQMNRQGYMHFVGIKLEGRINVSYTLHLHFFHEGQEVLMEEAVLIKTEIKSCRIGEFTRRHGEVSECEKCEAAHFNSDPKNEWCQSCEDIKGVRCSGLVAIPETHFWHVSSLSMKAIRCVGSEACDFKNRFQAINETEYQAHLNNTVVLHNDNNSYQCATGYEGVLCGSCHAGYGRDGTLCRKCASKGLGYFLLLMLMLWSIGVIAYFVRSVLQLGGRVEFNKRFGGSSTVVEIRREAMIESSPGTSSTVGIQIEQEIQSTPDNHLIPQDDSYYFEETNTFPLPMRPIHALNTAQPVHRDLAIVVDKKISMQRTMTKSKTKSAAKHTAHKSKHQRTTGVAARVHRLQHNAMIETRDPITLTNPFSEVLKVLLNFLQVTSVAVSINVNWSRAVRATLLSIGSVADLSTGGNFFSLDCFLGSSLLPKSLKRIVIATLFPVAVFFLFVFIWCSRTLLKKRDVKYLLHRIWLTILVTVYFFYIGMTKNLFRFFACVRIEEDEADTSDLMALNGYYWEEDTNIQCYKNEHSLLVGILVIPLFVLITIGFPLGTFIILNLKAENLEEEKVVRTYGFLYLAYDNHYWEIVIMLRKASIAALVVFAYALGANMQGLLCVLILVVSLVLQLSFTPFTVKLPQLNFFETCSLCATTCVFVCGLMFNDPTTTEKFKVFLSVLAILCIVGTSSFIGWNLILSSEDVLDMKLLEHEIMDCDEVLERSIRAKMKTLLLHQVSRVKTWVSLNTSHDSNKRGASESAIQTGNCESNLRV